MATIVIILSIALIVAIIFAFKNSKDSKQLKELRGEMFKLWRDRGESKDDPLYILLNKYGV